MPKSNYFRKNLKIVVRGLNTRIVLSVEFFLDVENQPIVMV